MVDPGQAAHPQGKLPSHSAVAEQPLLQCSLVPVFDERHQHKQDNEDEDGVVRGGESALAFDEVVATKW